MTTPTTAADTLSTATATRIVRDLAAQDIARRDEDPDAGTRDAATEIEGWYTAGAEAGDIDVCRAIDLLGNDEAARIYAARIAADTADHAPECRSCGRADVRHDPDGDACTTAQAEYIAAHTARTVTARRPDLARNDAIAAVLTTDPTMTADEVIAALDEAAEEHAANVAHEAAIK